MLLPGLKGLSEQLRRTSAHFEGILLHIGKQRLHALKNSRLVKADHGKLLGNADAAGLAQLQQPFRRVTVGDHRRGDLPGADGAQQALHFLL